LKAAGVSDPRRLPAFQEQVEYFGKRVLPIVRELQARRTERAA
jgi:hypothetical protein